MQLESLIIANSNKEILFCCHCIQPPRSWNDYQERLIKLIPDDNTNSEGFSFLYFDDLVIGISAIKTLKIIISAPVTSALVVDSIMEGAVNQIKAIIKYACKDDVSLASFINRNHYISFQMLIQEEISAKGFLRMLPTSEFDDVASF